MSKGWYMTVVPLGGPSCAAASSSILLVWPVESHLVLESLILTNTACIKFSPHWTSFLFPNLTDNLYHNLQKCSLSQGFQAFCSPSNKNTWLGSNIVYSTSPRRWYYSLTNRKGHCAKAVPLDSTQGVCRVKYTNLVHLTRHTPWVEYENEDACMHKIFLLPFSATRIICLKSLPRRPLTL